MKKELERRWNVMEKKYLNYLQSLFVKRNQAWKNI